MRFEIGVMESSHIRVPIIILKSPIFCFFLNRNQPTENNNQIIKIPGGRRNGVNIFLRINMYESPLLKRQAAFSLLNILS